MNELQLAKKIVKQWETYDVHKLSERNIVPEEVVVSKALLRINKEYGCEVRDPNGTIWEYAQSLEKKVKDLEEKIKSLEENNCPHQQWQIPTGTLIHINGFPYHVVSDTNIMGSKNPIEEK